MKFRINKHFVMVAISLVGFQVWSQEQKAKPLYETFDNQFGKQNLGINNGTIHINNDRSNNKTNRYYLQDQYALGDVAYDEQSYANIKLKYDLYMDVVVAKVSGETNTIGINLISEKVSDFTIGGIQFVNLTYGNEKLPSFVNGFYEVVGTSRALTLYIKHHKNKMEVIKPEGKFTNFDAGDSFIIWYKNAYHPVASPNDFTAIFPDFEQQIADFYQFNRELRKTDQKQFMRNLVQTVASLLPKDIR